MLQQPINKKGANPTVTMRSILVQLIPILIFLGPLMILSGFFYYLSSRRRGRRSPLTRDLLRGPGHSLLTRIEDLNLRIDCHAMTLSTIPLFLYASYLTRSHFGVAAQGDNMGIIYGLIWFIFTLFFGKRLQRLLKERHGYRLGLDCEMAVGQQLNNLMGAGYRVYHDVPAEGFNIDHVVVGRNGVFAVETKGRSKPAKGDVTVAYDGRTLKFPNRIETDYLKQAKGQAQWLSGWLYEITGERIPVQPVLVIPGWYVERIRRGDVLVLNGKNDTEFITTQWTHTALSRDHIQRIGDELERVCRDVESIAYKSSQGNGEDRPHPQPRKVFARVMPIRPVNRTSTR
jgi:hypothetical protein